MEVLMGNQMGNHHGKSAGFFPISQPHPEGVGNGKTVIGNSHQSWEREESGNGKEGGKTKTPTVLAPARICSLPAQAIWQLVATGGWWKPREIAEELGLTPRQVHSTLQTMSRHGHLTKRVIAPEKRVRLRGRGASERVQYSVDYDCIVPAGLTAKQVLEALKGATA